ncbi:hypothetical protein F0562_033136 [Nyssa sinensis]|uniref:Uncharacterized protein n=1 Tax=Nyssa sinensis TaxID=561372 RepID=A0A5J5AUE2_9ASTE|nr:hypothetical protein F0562_033136 [Nyssa sinensis]
MIDSMSLDHIVSKSKLEPDLYEILEKSESSQQVGVYHRTPVEEPPGKDNELEEVKTQSQLKRLSSQGKLNPKSAHAALMEEESDNFKEVSRSTERRKEMEEDIQTLELNQTQDRVTKSDDDVKLISFKRDWLIEAAGWIGIHNFESLLSS